MTKLSGVIISGLALSDLFFNWPHPAFDAAASEGEDLRAALRVDADNFASDYLAGTPVKAEDLVEDFFKRL